MHKTQTGLLQNQCHYLFLAQYQANLPDIWFVSILTICESEMKVRKCRSELKPTGSKNVNVCLRTSTVNFDEGILIGSGRMG